MFNLLCKADEHHPKRRVKMPNIDCVQQLLNVKNPPKTAETVFFLPLPQRLESAQLLESAGLLESAQLLESAGLLESCQLLESAQLLES